MTHSRPKRVRRGTQSYEPIDVPRATRNEELAAERAAASTKTPAAARNFMENFCGHVVRAKAKAAPKRKASAAPAIAPPKETRISQKEKESALSLATAGAIGKDHKRRRGANARKAVAGGLAQFDGEQAQTQDTTTRLANGVEKLLFSAGSMPNVVATFSTLLDRPAIVALTLFQEYITAQRANAARMRTVVNGKRYLTKEMRSMAAAMSSLSRFVDDLNQGERTEAKHDAMLTALAAVSGDASGEAKGLLNSINQLVGAPLRMWSKAIKARQEMGDKDAMSHLIDPGNGDARPEPSWILPGMRRKREGFPAAALQVIIDILHTDEYSRVDNTNKKPVRVPKGVVGGTVWYELHERRALLFSAKNAWMRIVANDHLYSSIVAETITKQNPTGYKGCVRQVRKAIANCECWTTLVQDFCACPVHSELEENLRNVSQARARVSFCFWE